jgi:hypothetical protein
MKQTAVEWLVEQILQKVRNYEDGDVETEEEPFVIEYVNKYNFNIDLTKFIEQAKEMEKKQLCYFYVKGAEAEINNPYVSNIEFYNKTFKSE